MSNDDLTLCFRPLVLPGKLAILLEELQKAEEVMVTDISYIGLDQSSKFAEWISFLETILPNKLLALLMPEYCEHMSVLTQTSRNYCGF